MTSVSRVPFTVVDRHLLARYVREDSHLVRFYKKVSQNAVFELTQYLVNCFQVGFVLLELLVLLLLNFVFAQLIETVHVPSRNEAALVRVFQ